MSSVSPSPDFIFSQVSLFYYFNIFLTFLQLTLKQFSLIKLSAGHRLLIKLTIRLDIKSGDIFLVLIYSTSPHSTFTYSNSTAQHTITQQEPQVKEILFWFWLDLMMMTTKTIWTWLMYVNISVNIKRPNSPGTSQLNSETTSKSVEHQVPPLKQGRETICSAEWTVAPSISISNCSKTDYITWSLEEVGCDEKGEIRSMRKSEVNKDSCHFTSCLFSHRACDHPGETFSWKPVTFELIDRAQVFSHMLL